MLVNTALPTRTTQIAYPPIVAVSLALAALWADLFRAIYPAIARLCGARLDRATALLQREGAIVQVDIRLYQVASEWGPGSYLVNDQAHTCTCPDAVVNHSPVCKHRLAVTLAVNGPSWQAAVRQQEHEICLAQTNVDAAALHLAQIGDQMETIAIRQGRDLPVSDLEIDLVRAANIDANIEHDRLVAIRDAIRARPLHSWIALPTPAAPTSTPASEITRIDITVMPDGTLTTHRWAAGWTASTPAAEHTASTRSLDDCLAWLESHGWLIRRWPGGARAWRGEIAPVRNRSAIQRLREQLTRRPVPGVQAHTLDLAYDW